MSTHTLIDQGTHRNHRQRTGTMGHQSLALDQGLLALLGNNITSFPLNEEAYIEALKLKHQQEVTKQHYYKLELANKNLAIIQLALKAKIPAEMIVQLCVDKETNMTELEESILKLVEKEKSGREGDLEGKGGDKERIEAQAGAAAYSSGVLALPQISISQPMVSPKHKPATSISNLSSLSISSEPGSTNSTSPTTTSQSNHIGNSPSLGRFNPSLSHPSANPHAPPSQNLNPNINSSNQSMSPNFAHKTPNLLRLNQNYHSNPPQAGYSSPQQNINRQPYLPQPDQLNRSPVLHPNYPPMNAVRNRNFHHMRSNSQPAQVHSYSPDNVRKQSMGNSPYPDGLSPSVPPMNYRFGTGSTKRPLSPAKIGAQAVANLATPTSPYRHPTSNIRRTRSTLSNHQRHSSMPSEKELFNKSLTLPMGGTSSIQVNPLPAQPLTSADRQPPSQESMTSLQHIIQFHHWRPEEGEAPQNTGNTIFKGHKRHKSTSEANALSFQDNTPDLKPSENVQTPTPSPRIKTIGCTDSKSEDNTIEDITMDDTETESSRLAKNAIERDDKDQQSPSKEGSSNRNVGRYPHNILSS